ncbi:MAG: Asp-tRNA(Asn)/Glu-tRNA(Gln) amidotransferase subunit GatA [Phycisphaerae bacterium]|nr:Asp-tRNA(Asn)/Glu-tRNA(Gln) amidotransferase subunit GatA [Phycisphaerae bacterium]
MLELTARQLRDRIVRRDICSVEAVEAVFAQIDKSEPTVGAYLTLDRTGAMEAARRVDEKIAAGNSVGALAGVPMAIKDNLCRQGAATTCGSKILANFHSPYDAHVVERLHAADAVILGKTNLDEFAMGSSTENSGLKRTVNPWDPTRVPGGSSGGSAAAVAARMCYAALGSDTGGSIRQPASFCGVVGLKPTYGRVSRYGLVAYGSSLDQIGPLTRDVADSALILQVIAGHDLRDSTSVSEEIAPIPDYSAHLDDPLKGLRIAFVPHLNEGADPQVLAAFQNAVELYRSLGANIVEVRMPHLDYAIACYYVIATAEASSNLSRYDGVHYGHRSKKADEFAQVYNLSRAEGFGAEVKRRIMLGTYALSSGYYDAYYLKALKVRNLIRQDFSRVFEQADCILMPVAPSTAFGLGEKTADPLQMYLADIYTIAVNLAGIPGISVPCGFDDHGLPIGLQILSGPFTEDKLLRVARMFEKTANLPQRVPAVLG